MKRLFPELRGRFPFVYGHAVAFPLTQLRDVHLPLGCPRDLVLDAADLAHLAERVPALLAFWGQRHGRGREPLDARGYKRFCESVLLRRLHLVPTLGAELELGRQAFVRLTKEQAFAADWWEVLACLYPDPARTDDPDGACADADDHAGYLLVFHDPTQDIFERGGQVPSHTGAVFSLPYNLRNTKRIAELVARLGDLPCRPHPDAPDGGEVIIRRQEPGPKARGQIANVIRDLVGKQRVPSEQIVVLTPHSRPNSFLANQAALAGLMLVDEESERGEGTLLHTSIGKYKGLESDVVVLADVDMEGGDPRSDRRAVYVAVSRARQGLFVFEQGEGLAELVGGGS